MRKSVKISANDFFESSERGSKMASRIAGITVEIGGNVGPLSKALESVNKVIKTTQTQLKDVERLLKLDPTNTQLLTQKQALLKDSISATKEKLEALKTAQEQAKNNDFVLSNGEFFELKPGRNLVQCTGLYLNRVWITPNWWTV